MVRWRSRRSVILSELAGRVETAGIDVSVARAGGPSTLWGRRLDGAAALRAYSGVASDIDSFDLGAAGVRRSASDLRAFSSALAARLEGALPDRVMVKRARDGLFSRESHVSSIEFRGERAVYRLAFARGGVGATRAKAVRGVVISTAPVSMEAWLAEVRDEVQALADAGGSAADVLHGFL